jgi:hypothetical protein
MDAAATAASYRHDAEQVFVIPQGKNLAFPWTTMTVQNTSTSPISDVRLSTEVMLQWTWPGALGGTGPSGPVRHLWISLADMPPCSVGTIKLAPADLADAEGVNSHHFVGQLLTVDALYFVDRSAVTWEYLPGGPLLHQSRYPMSIQEPAIGLAPKYTAASGCS